MPIIKSAKKKLRQDKNRTRQNLLVKKSSKKVISIFKRQPKSAMLVKVFSELDKAAKKGIFHPNKVARLKSRLSKLLKSTSASKSAIIPKPVKTKSPRKKKSVV